MDNMNFEPDNRPACGYPYPSYQPKPKNTFATAAMILGICSLASLFTLILPIPLGALAILFAVLSKQKGAKMETTAKSGIATALIGMFIGIVVSVNMLIAGFNMLRPENRDSLNKQFEQMYGKDFDEYMSDMYGEDFDDYLDKLFQ